ncbi:hypothetical protein MTR67_048108 [Solanum verrucosum]|uniref:Uncharacterized protein n=1 Tax=Solanum verrucosum TaxID=315347 RepID=A0AAF0ZYV6_SOLVR|nr:hypothetical protein MTR67_048108 [Solanum verrucosum]
MLHEAISFYSGLKHVVSSVCDQHTYSYVIKACMGTKQILLEIGDVRVADVLYGLLVKLGNAYVNDIDLELYDSPVHLEQFSIKVVDLFLEDVEAEDVGTTDDVIFVSALMETSQLQLQGFTGYFA